MDGVRVTGLWRNRAKSGKTYLSGNVGLAKLLVLTNDFKKAEKDPDYYLLVTASEKKSNGTKETEPTLEEAGL